MLYILQPVALLPFLGMCISYVVCLFPPFRLNNRARKAIAVETGIQNGGIANSVLILSFGDQLDIYSNAVTIPLIYNISQTVLMAVMVLGYRLWLRIAKPYKDDKKNDQMSNTSKNQPDNNQNRNSRAEYKEVVEKTTDHKVG